MDRLDNEIVGDFDYKTVWLIRHLEQYLERWLGFAQIPTIGVSASLGNELFCVVFTAANVLGDRIARINPVTSFPRQEWTHFKNALEWIQKAPEDSELARISDTFHSFCKLLPYGDIDIDMAQ